MQGNMTGDLARDIGDPRSDRPRRIEERPWIVGQAGGITVDVMTRSNQRGASREILLSSNDLTIITTPSQIRWPSVEGR